MIWNFLPPLPLAVSEKIYFFVIWVTRPFKSVQWKGHMFFNVRHSSAELSGKCMFGLSGLWCGQLRAVVRGSAADDGDDSAAYWPVTPLSAVIAALTDTDHPLSSGQNTFIILLTFFFFPPQHLSPRQEKYIFRTCNPHVPLLKRRDVIDLQAGQNNKVSWFQVSGLYWGVDRSAAGQSRGMKCGQEKGVTTSLIPLHSLSHSLFMKFQLKLNCMLFSCYRIHIYFVNHVSCSALRKKQKPKGRNL